LFYFGELLVGLEVEREVSDEVEEGSWVEGFSLGQSLGEK